MRLAGALRLAHFQWAEIEFRARPQRPGAPEPAPEICGLALILCVEFVSDGRESLTETRAASRQQPQPSHDDNDWPIDLAGAQTTITLAHTVTAN